MPWMSKPNFFLSKTLGQVAFGYIMFKKCKPQRQPGDLVGIVAILSTTF